MRGQKSQRTLPLSEVPYWESYDPCTGTCTVSAWTMALLLGDALSDGEAAYPHCDSRVLHAPRECEYCDHFSQRQMMRLIELVNFTGHHEPDYAPCPADAERGDTHKLWPGNQAYPNR